MSCLVGNVLGCAAEARIRLLEPEEGELPALREEFPGFDASLGTALYAPDPFDDVQRPPPEPIDEPMPIDEPADAATPVGEPVAPTVAALALRYDFEGEGEVVQDVVGESDGVVQGGGALDGAGALELDGWNDYVDLPNGVISGRDSITIMVWLHWYGGVCWQRVFDFGSNDAGEDAVGNATSSLFLTPASCPAGVMTSMTERLRERLSLFARRAFPTDHMRQVVLVVDAELGRRFLYLDGELEASGPAGHPVSQLDDVNNWLGRSQWIQDRYLRATYEELRIYDGALDAGRVAELYRRGPDQP